MKPSDLQQEADSELLAAELAHEMLAFVAERYRSASEAERLELTLEYGPVLRVLQRTVHKAARRQCRRYPGTYEQKGA